MKKLIVYLILLSSILIAESVVMPTNPFRLPQGFQVAPFSPYGTSGITNSISNIGYTNPAAVTNFRSIGVGISYQFETKIDEAYIANIGHEKYKNELPNSAGIVIPVENFSFGISFRQLYNSKADLGKIPITTAEYPDGTGEFYEPEFKTNLISYSFIASYIFENIFDNSDLALGFRISRNDLFASEELLNYGFDLTESEYNWGAGLVFNHRIDEQKSLRAGLSYESNFEIETPYTLEEHNSGGISPNSEFPVIIYHGFLLKGEIPASAKLDLELNYVEDFTFLLNAQLKFWEDIHENLKNEFSFGGGAIYSFNNNLDFSLSFFTTGREYQNNLLDLNERLSVFYLIGGVNYNYEPLNFGLTIADSHLLSDDWRKQTIVNGTISLIL